MGSSLFRQMSHDPLDVPPVIRRDQEPIRFIKDQAVELGYADGRDTSRGEEEGGESAGSADDDVGLVCHECVVWSQSARGD